jgi:hypothetical protein
MTNNTSNDHLLELAARAERGARFFDGKEPGWWTADRVNVDTLNQSDGCACVFAQLFGYYDLQLVAKVFGQPSYAAAEPIAIAHGLLPEGAYLEGLRLTEFWREQILSRRREATASDADTPETPPSAGPAAGDQPDA